MIVFAFAAVLIFTVLYIIFDIFTPGHTGVMGYVIGQNQMNTTLFVYHSRSSKAFLSQVFFSFDADH
jgi:hypothetical protein